MSMINKELMTRKEVSKSNHITVACQYCFGTLDDKTPFIELATRNPESKTGSVSQIIRISKPELIMLIGEMYSEGVLKFADLDDLISIKKSANQ